MPFLLLSLLLLVIQTNTVSPFAGGFGKPSVNQTPSKKKPSPTLSIDPTTSFDPTKTLSDQFQLAVDSLPASKRDDFFSLLPSLISTKFPQVPHDQLHRIAQFVLYYHTDKTNLPDEILNDPRRPHNDIHAYMPLTDVRTPFLDPKLVSEISTLMSENYDEILKEFNSLVASKETHFQSVTELNYDSGWTTLPLFYNSHRIDDFPYHLAPTTLRILETLPIAGRIAGFNRQKPKTGIPLHSDGNNMWLTLQMCMKATENSASITVGGEKKYYEPKKLLFYDTTFEHETFNDATDEERVVLHVDFWNFLSMTAVEVEIMQYIYQVRENFLAASGFNKVQNMEL